MNITKNQIDDLNATIKIELGKEDYAGRVEKALKDYQKKVVVNGFRPGKTPMGIVKKMYGKSLLVDEINKVLGESLNNYIKENNLQILGEPLPNETEQKELNLEDENFEFLYDIALSPEVNAKMSKREKIPFYTIKVDDEMIDKQIESICKNNGNMIAVDEIEGTEYLKGELIELDADGNVKEGGIKNEDASMSVFHMKDEEAVNAFKGKKVAVQKGTIEEGLAKKQLKDSTVVSLTAMGEAINEVKSGQVDAVDLEKPVAEGYVAQNPDLALASVALKVNDGDAKAVAMAKGNDKLKEAVNKVIKKLKDNGTYDEYIKDASKYTAVE